MEIYDRVVLLTDAPTAFIITQMVYPGVHDVRTNASFHQRQKNAKVSGETEVEEYAARSNQTKGDHRFGYTFESNNIRAENIITSGTKLS